MLKPMQAAFHAQVREQSCREDATIVWFAVSNAHIIGPFCVFLNSLYWTTWTETSADITRTATFSSSSSSIGTSISFIVPEIWKQVTCTDNVLYIATITCVMSYLLRSTYLLIYLLTYLYLVQEEEKEEEVGEEEKKGYFRCSQNAQKLIVPT